MPAITPTRKGTSKPLTFKAAKLRRHPDGRIEALSGGGLTIYTVSLDPESCTCPATVRCYHLRTARVRYGQAAESVSYADEQLAWALGTLPSATCRPNPEPPTPMTPAPFRPSRTVAGCNWDLYGDDPDCPEHGQAVAE